VVCIPLAGIRNTTPITDAAKQLGIPPARPIALLFGAGHGDKDRETVAASFRTLDDWQLLIVGRAASRSEIDSAHWRVPPVVIGGFVDGETRSLAFEAADIVVLSFVAGYRRNSGTFMDAMAHGVPVVVSEDSVAADLTERYGVGVTFIAGDSDSLQQALGRVPAAIDPAALAAIRAELSNDAVARAHIAVLDHA
jgi:glycosyltransferase involved in cell wall biosynthesis